MYFYMKCPHLEVAWRHDKLVQDLRSLLVCSRSANSPTIKSGSLQGTGLDVFQPPFYHKRIDIRL